MEAVISSREGVPSTHHSDCVQNGQKLENSKLVTLRTEVGMFLWCSSYVTGESPSSSLLKLPYPPDSSKKWCYLVYRLL